MRSYSQNDNATFEASILEELEKKQPVLSRHPLTPILNRLRSRQNQRFDALYPSIDKIRRGDKGMLNEYENFVYSKFEACRNEHREVNYHYSVQYRGSYILNYNLAVIAVSLAVISLGLLYVGAIFKAPPLLQISSYIVFAFASVKAACLLIILVNTRQSNKYGFNQRAIIYRYLAEQSRVFLYLPLLGIRHLPLPSVGRFIKNKWKESWLEKYYRSKIKKVFAIIDQEALEKHVEIDYNLRLAPLLTFIQADWVRGQVDYHTQNSIKQNAINERLEKLVSSFNIIVLVAVGVDILIDLIAVFGWLPESMHDTFHLYGAPVILIGATIIPAFVASYNGLQFQTEAKKLSERAQFMTNVFKELDDKYEFLIKRIKTFEGQSDSPGSFTQEAIELLTETAQVMIDEVVEWTFIYTKDLREP